MDAWLWGTASLAVFIYLYWYYSRCYRYWEQLGIPSAKGFPPLGSNIAVLFKDVHEIERDRYKSLGRIYGGYEGTRPVLTCADPKCLKNILVKDFPYFINRRDFQLGDPIGDNMLSVLNGEKWKRIRNIISPAFSTGKIKRMTGMILESAGTLCDNFATFAREGKPADAKRVFGAFTMDVIASTAFATKVDSHNDTDNKFVQQARKVFSRNVPIKFVLFLLMPSIFRLLGMKVFSKDVMSFFKNATLKIIEERKKTGEVRNDFLQLMIEASEEQEKDTEQKISSSKQAEENDTKLGLSSSHKGLTQNEIIAQSVLFFLAGYDTTASTLSFVAYQMALNPNYQECLIKEIDAVVTEYKGELTYEGVQNMKFLDNVISETLRMFSPAIRLERRANEEYNLVDAGLVIPKGMIIGVPVYAMHYDPEFFPNPETFDPDRFSTEAKSERNQFTYLPFGAGPRNCVGLRFALMEIKICLARFFSQFRVKTCPQTKIPLKFYSGQGLLQPKDVFLSFELRTDGVLGDLVSHMEK